MFLTNQNYDCG